MMLSPLIYEHLVEIHKKKLLDDVQSSQRLDTARAARSGLQERLFVGGGAWLISVGQRMQARYICSHDKAFRPG